MQHNGSILLIAVLAQAMIASRQPSDGREPGGATGSAAEARPSEEGASFIYPGFGAFAIPDPPRLPVALSKPLLCNGALDPGYFILHFRSAVTQADEAWLTGHAQSVDPRDGAGWWVPHDALVVWVDGLATWLALRRWERTDWVGRYEPAYKIDPALATDAREGAPVLFDVDPVPGHPRELLIQELEAAGARVVDRPLLVEAPPSSLLRLAWIEGIRTIQPHLDSGPPGALGDSSGIDPIRTAGKISLGPGGSRANLVVPTTVTLDVVSGLGQNGSALNTGDLAALRLSDNIRFSLQKQQHLSLAFDRTVPAGVTIVAIRVFVEHFEQQRVRPGDILWSLGRGSLAAPSIVEITSAPYRAGESLESLDVWSPATILTDPNALVLSVQNNNQDDNTVLDRVFVEVDYLPPSSAPRITSTPNSTGVVGQAYGYDADKRAEASGTAPILWSLASAPAGFAIDASTGLVSWLPSTTGTFAVTLQAANTAGSATQSFAVQVTATAPLPPTLLPSNPTSIGYCPPERLALGPAASQQRLNVFLPPGAVPVGGWPVVLNNRAGGGLAFTPLTSLSNTGATAPLHAFVSNRVAVVDFGVTGVGNGQGLFYPPGHPSGRYESFRPQDDDPEKEAEWAVQWLKTQTAFPLDANRICVRGSSEGAMIAIWATLGPERARAAGSAQVRASTRVKAVLALQPPTSMWAFDQTPSLASLMVAHFEQQGRPGVPATALQQVAESLQKDGSIMRFAFQSAAAQANNAAQAICLIYGEPVKLVGGAPADMSLDAVGFPNLHNTLSQPFIHDSWEGYVFYKRLIDLSPQSAAFHGSHSIFAVRDTTALAPPRDFHTRTYSGLITGTQANMIANDWVLLTLGVR